MHPLLQYHTENLAALRVPCTSPIHPFLSLPEPLESLILYVSSFAFSGMSYSTCPFQIVFFHSVLCIEGSPCLFGLIAHFFLFLIIFQCLDGPQLFTHSPVKDILVASVVAIMNETATHICVHVFVWM